MSGLSIEGGARGPESAIAPDSENFADGGKIEQETRLKSALRIPETFSASAIRKTGLGFPWRRCVCPSRSRDPIRF
jgi:hypothetical protein